MKNILFILLFLFMTPVFACEPIDNFMGSEGVVSADQSLQPDLAADFSAEAKNLYIDFDLDTAFASAGADLKNGDRSVFPVMLQMGDSRPGSPGGRPASLRSHLALDPDI